MNIVTRLEEAVLLAVQSLEENAYGVTINRWVSRAARKTYTMGALYYSLDRLLKKGLVSKLIRNRPGEKGGRPRTYYRLTRKGRQALREARDYQRHLWKEAPETALAEKNPR